jgi:hypothetical protein
MKGLGQRASFLAVLTVMATALLGAAYTLWSEDLKLTVNASTGSLDGYIYCGSTGDNDDRPPLGDTIAGFPDPGKDVGDIVSKGNQDPDGAGPNIANHSYVLTVTNAYPGYAFDCEVHLVNTGTVPWHVEIFEIMIMWPDGTSTTVDCSLQGGNCIYGLNGSNPDNENPQNDDNDWQLPDIPPLFIKVPNFVGCQVHPGSNNDKSGSLIVGVNQAALEGETYQIMLKYRLNQWNESGWKDCGDKTGPPILP